MHALLEMNGKFIYFCTICMYVMCLTVCRTFENYSMYPLRRGKKVEATEVKGLEGTYTYE